ATHRSDSAISDCVHCGNCLNGCPVGAMWTSLPVISKLTQNGAVRHRSGHIVKRLEADTGGEFIVSETDGGRTRSGPFSAIVLAAGSIASRQIAQASFTRNQQQQSVRILDNDIYVLPLLQSETASTETSRFTLSEAAMAIADEAESRIFHLQLYRPGGSLLGPLEPIIRKSFGLRRLLEAKASQFAIGFLYLHSSQSRELTARFGTFPDANPVPTNITAKEVPAARSAVRRALGRLRDLRGVTGLRPLSNLALRGDPGLSGHIGGTLPMRDMPGPFESDRDGRLSGGRPIFVADLSSFPEMPAQNPTFIAVANSMRVASKILKDA
ncbi:MAG: hypothetical protein ACR2OY_09920, partial [Boseongicola sp.]